LTIKQYELVKLPAVKIESVKIGFIRL